MDAYEELKAIRELVDTVTSNTLPGTTHENAQDNGLAECVSRLCGILQDREALRQLVGWCEVSAVAIPPQMAKTVRCPCGATEDAHGTVKHVTGCYFG